MAAPSAVGITLSVTQIENIARSTLALPEVTRELR